MALPDIAFAANQERFTGFADVYDAHRPQAPVALADLLCQLAGIERPRLVVDLGCGTGLSTRFWIDKAERVIGVDPTEAMLNQARAHTTASPTISYRTGFAHATGLPAAEADIVTCSQSLHWMDPMPTFAEAARILRSGGVFAAYDNDWPPTTANWEADAAYVEMVARVNALEKELGLGGTLKQWAKPEHLGRMRASGSFRYTAELLVHHRDLGNAERLVGLALSMGNVQTLLKNGVAEADFGLDRLRAVADETLGAELKPWHWSYRVRVGVV
jgi:ubiquinone/menaquinone biosynthesis C-methylase UbiE